jgi:hypothetical protein
MARTSEDIQTELGTLLRRLADPVEAGESVKSCIRRASIRAGLTYGQTKRLWYSEWRNIPAHIADELRIRAAEHDRKLKHTALQTILAMQESDPDLFGESIATLGDLLRGSGEVGRASRRSR